MLWSLGQRKAHMHMLWSLPGAMENATPSVVVLRLRDHHKTSGSDCVVDDRVDKFAVHSARAQLHGRHCLRIP